jgi:hypothetical protein
MSCRLITGQSSKELGAEHVGLYYDFNKGLVPEAFRPFHQVRLVMHASNLVRDSSHLAVQSPFIIPFTKVGPLAHPVRSQTLAHRFQ